MQHLEIGTLLEARQQTPARSLEQRRTMRTSRNHLKSIKVKRRHPSRRIIRVVLGALTPRGYRRGKRPDHSFVLDTWIIDR
jgi:hypothetical protein